MATDETTSKAVQASSSPERPPTAAEQRATQHEGTTDTEVLVSDIEKTREELAETIDAIVDKVSPKKVAERTKQQASVAAKQGVQDATAIVKETASNAAGVVREKASTATELLKEKTGAVKGAAASVKEKRSAGSHPDSSPLTGPTSVAVGSAAPITSSSGTSSSGTSSSGTSSSGTGEPSPLPAGTVSVDAGAVPPPEPGAAGSLAGGGAQRSGPALSSTSGVPARSASSYASAVPSRVPVFAGAGAAAAVAVVLLVLRRRRR